MAVLSAEIEEVRQFWRIFLFGTTFVRQEIVTAKKGVTQTEEEIINKYKI